MSENRDFPYVMRRGVRALDEHVPEAQATISTLNWLIELARDEGVRFAVVWADGVRLDVTDTRIARFEWTRPDDPENPAFLEDAEVVGVADGGELVGISRQAMYHRIVRTEKRGEATPYRRVGSGGSAMLLAKKSAVLEWAKTWQGVQAPRPSRRVPKKGA